MTDLTVLLTQIDMVMLAKAGLFFISGLAGMIVAYTHKWSSAKSNLSWCEYMTGDSHEVGMALTKLVTACWVAGSFEYLNGLELKDIINAGVLIGMAVPNQVDQQKAQSKQLLKKQNSSEAQEVG